MLRISPARTVGASVATALLVTGVALLPASAADSPWDAEAYRGAVQVVTGEDDTPELLDGVVFEDTNRNSVRDEGEPGVAGVKVANGRDVVLTDAEGRYEIAVDDNTTVAMSQPAGYRVPVDADNIPQFSYNHLPAGSPEFEFAGIAPTGPTPDAVHFPLVVDEATARAEQNFVVATDTQVSGPQEVEYARAGTYSDLAARDDYSSAGVLFTGDQAYDDLSVNDDIRALTAMINGPAWMLPGNHDMNFDAPTRDHAYDTFRDTFGPTYYSFDAGDVHVVMLETIDYPRSDSDSYMNVLDEDQLAWLRADIAATPEDKAVLLAGHAPLATLVDGSTDQHTLSNHREITEILEGREVLNVGGHVHALEVYREGDLLQEWHDFFGIDGVPFTVIDAGAVSGNWYSGRVTEDGYPTAIMADGAQPGVLNLAYDGTEYVESYSVRGDEEGEFQINLGLNSPAYRAYWDANHEHSGEAEPMENPLTIPTGDLGETWLTTNFILGGTGDTIEVRIDDREPTVAERIQKHAGEPIGYGVEYSDPAMVLEQMVHGGSVSNRSSHIWRTDLPTDLAPGEHTVRVKATTVKGVEYTDEMTFTVVEGDGAQAPGDGAAAGGEGDIPVTAEIPGLPGQGDDEGTAGEGPVDGVLALSVADGGLQLGEARNAGDRLRLTGVLPQVTVTDTRADAGWSVTGRSSDLHAGDAVLRADALGWAPFVAEGPAAAGDEVRPALDGGAGLAAPATLGSGAEQGTAALSADVRLEAPVDTEAGSYTGGITVSLFPQD